MKRWVILSLTLIASLFVFSKTFADESLKNYDNKLYLSSFSYNEIDNLAKNKLDNNSYEKKWLLDYLYNFPTENYPIFTLPSQGFFAFGNILDSTKKDLIEKKAFKPHIVKLIKKYAKEGSTVLDIGAHIGYHTLSLSKAVKNNGKVLAFESNIQLFRELFFNLILNNTDNCKVYFTNISDINKDIEPSNLFQDNEVSSLVEDKTKTFADQITLDSLNLKNVSLIKINVEQINVFALDTMKETIKKNKPIILLDISNEYKHSNELKDIVSNILEKLKILKYDVKKISDKYLDYIAFPKKDDDQQCDAKVLLAILARNKAHVLTAYLQCIENLDYEKKKIGIYINTNNNTDNTKEILKDWMKKNEKKYRFIYFENKEYNKDLPNSPHDWTKERFKILGNIRNKSLQKAKEYDSDYYFVVDCDNFIVPSTLKDLIEKDKPIIAPMLISIPEKNDAYSNFFCDVTESGYYKNHPKYLEILNREETGTFKVPVVHCTYLIKSEYLDILNYVDDTDHHEFVIFSKIARKNNIDQYICNEKNFGYLLHWKNDRLTLQEEKKNIASINLIPTQN